MPFPLSIEVSVPSTLSATRVRAAAVDAIEGACRLEPESREGRLEFRPPAGWLRPGLMSFAPVRISRGVLTIRPAPGGSILECSLACTGAVVGWAVMVSVAVLAMVLSFGTGFGVLLPVFVGAGFLWTFGLPFLFTRRYAEQYLRRIAAMQSV